MTGAPYLSVPDVLGAPVGIPNNAASESRPGSIIAKAAALLYNYNISARAKQFSGKG